MTALAFSRLTRLALAAAMSLVAIPSARAQLPEQLQPGVRVRVWLPEPQQQENAPWRRQLLRATVKDATGGILQLEVPGTSGGLAIGASDIRRIDVSRGTSRAASAVERAFGLAVVGAITAMIQNEPDAERWPNYSSSGQAAAGGAAWGAALGAVIGFTFPTERWRRVRR